MDELGLRLEGGDESLELLELELRKERHLAAGTKISVRKSRELIPKDQVRIPIT